jgi:hypothetical protein
VPWHRWCLSYNAVLVLVTVSPVGFRRICLSRHNYNIHSTCLTPETYLRNGMFFRTGSIQFKDNNCRINGRNSTRHRFCSLCDLGVVEDEQHMIFQCPFYDDLREDQRWAHLFNKILDGMTWFMSQRRQPEVYEFLFRVVRRRFPVSKCPPRTVP